MSNHPITDATATEQQPTSSDHHSRPGWRRRPLLLGAVAIPLVLGVAGLSFAQNRVAAPTPVAPTPIGSLMTSRDVAAKGDVAEIYGNKFIVQDPTGRALVETGPRGAGGTLVKTGETVTVQGRFENGFMHAAVITHADGSQVLLGPAGGPPPGGRGPLAWAKDKIGLGPKLDVPAMTATVERAGYSEVRVLGSGPRHLEVAAKGPDGRERVLHVNVDGRVRER